MTQRAFKPIYVLHGDDEFRRDEARRKVIEEVVGTADSQLAVSSHEGTAELSEVLDDLRTLPLMAPCRLVILRDADDFVTAHRAALEKYLENPCSTGALLLMVAAWASNWNLAKTAARIGQVFDCSAPKGNLADWIAQAAQKRGKRIDADASRLLEQYVGADLSALDMEVEKLSLYAAQRPAITGGDVNLLTIAMAEPADWALENALRDSDAKTALTVLDRILTRRGLEFMVLGKIGSVLRQAIKGATLAKAGDDPAKALPPHVPFSAKKAFLDLLRRRPIERLEADLRRLLAADLAMKSGGDARGTMQELVVALCA